MDGQRLCRRTIMVLVETLTPGPCVIDREPPLRVLSIWRLLWARCKTDHRWKCRLVLRAPHFDAGDGVIGTHQRFSNVAVVRPEQLNTHGIEDAGLIEFESGRRLCW